MSEPNPVTKPTVEKKLKVKPIYSVLVIGSWLGGAVILLAVVFPLILQAREAARESQSRNNLKQIGLSLHNYHDVYRVLPPGGSIREDGTPHHGWMTSLMPYLDSSPLYSMLDFDEAWDHPFNADLFADQQPAYIHPSHPKPSDDQFFAITHDLANPLLLHRNSSISFDDIENGTGHRWLVGEIAGGFQPAAYPFNWRSWNGRTNSTVNGYGLASKDSTQFLLADGAVRRVKKENSKEFWRNHSDKETPVYGLKYAVPPLVFPINAPSIEVKTTTSENASISVIAVRGNESVQIRFRIFRWKKGDYDANMNGETIKFAAKHFPEATEITINETLTAEYLMALEEFGSLRKVKAYGIEFDEHTVRRLANLNTLEHIQLNQIAEEEIDHLSETMPELLIGFDRLSQYNF